MIYIVCLCFGKHFHIYLQFTAEGTLYIDDGESFDYRTGKYIYAKITFKDKILTYRFVFFHTFYISYFGFVI